MRPKHKVTGCARFFIFLIIFVPIVFFGAAYFRGEDGWQLLKDQYHSLFGKPSRDSKTNDRDTYRIEDLQEDLDDARNEIRDLRNQLREKEKEIEKLKTGEQ